MHSQSDTWLIASDFNIVSSQEEKAGGNHVSLQDMEDFNQMILTNGLTDAGFTGNSLLGLKLGLVVLKYWKGWTWHSLV